MAWLGYGITHNEDCKIKQISLVSSVGGAQFIKSKYISDARA
jgi:hypothetical protein